MLYLLEYGTKKVLQNHCILFFFASILHSVTHNFSGIRVELQSSKNKNKQTNYQSINEYIEEFDALKCKHHFNIAAGKDGAHFEYLIYCCVACKFTPPSIKSYLNLQKCTIIYMLIIFVLLICVV